MILLITGATHTGKTLLAQHLLEEKCIPYLSLDHLKMGLIRSGLVSITPTDGLDRITQTVWPVAREMIKTCLENGQSLIVEGCYVPPDWKRDFDREQLVQMRCACMVMSEAYIRGKMQEIRRYACEAEQRMDDAPEVEALVRENAYYEANFDEIYWITDDYARAIDALRREL